MRDFAAPCAVGEWIGTGEPLSCESNTPSSPGLVMRAGIRCGTIEDFGLIQALLGFPLKLWNHGMLCEKIIQVQPCCQGQGHLL